jgi:hypothetical protein
MACQPFAAKWMSVMDNIQRPELSKSAIATQTIRKKRDKTADISVKRSGAAIWAMATGRKAKITKAIPPSHTMPALK